MLKDLHFDSSMKLREPGDVDDIEPPIKAINDILDSFITLHLHITLKFDKRDSLVYEYDSNDDIHGKIHR